MGAADATAAAREAHPCLDTRATVEAVALSVAFELLSDGRPIGGADHRSGCVPKLRRRRLRDRVVITATAEIKIQLQEL